MEYVLFLTRADKSDDYDCEWAQYMFGPDVVVNGPAEDLVGIEDEEDYLLLEFETLEGMYYAMGRLDRMGIKFKLSKKGSMMETDRRIAQRKHRQRRETKYKVHVKPVNRNCRVNEGDLWSDMNCLNGLHSVAVKHDGQYAFLSYASNAAKWYVIGFFEHDTVYNVSTTKSRPDSD